MGKSKWKVRNGKKIQKFRKDNGITRCQCCGLSIESMCHHYLCNKCWYVKNNKPLEWKHYYKVTHEKYYDNNCKKECIDDTTNTIQSSLKVQSAPS